MTINDLRRLSQDELMRLVASAIISQNPRLKRGIDMDGPACAFKHGLPFNNHYSRPLGTDQYDFSLDAPIISSTCIELTPRQVLDGHPFIKLTVGDANYLHMQSVVIGCRLGDVRAEDVVRVRVGALDVDVMIMQSSIDEHTIITAKFGLSK